MFNAYNRGWTMNPLRAMQQLQREVNRLMGDYADLRAAGYPAVNIYADDDHAIVTAEVPGVEPTSLDVTVSDNTLTVRGERTAPAGGEDMVVHRRERRLGSFSRTIELPFALDPDAVGAEYTHGVLKISVARSEAAKPRKIKVQA